MQGIGIAGLGNMGAPIARRLAAAGHRVHGFDIDAAKLAVAQGHGVIPVASPRALAEHCDLVLLALPTPAVAQAVALGEDGIAAAGRPALVVDLSTTGPEAEERLEAGLSGHGVRLVGCPVSGGPAGAEAGTLTLMAGGAADDIAAARPVLESFGKVIVVGDRPALAQSLKLLNNILSLTNLVAAAEALVFGTRAGLDPAVMLEVLNASSGRNSATETKIPEQVATGRFAFGIDIALSLKDASLYLDAARARGVPTDVASRVRDLIGEAVETYGGSADLTFAVRLVEDRGQAEVRYHRPGNPPET